MARYQLTYWSVPFRGELIRATLAYLGEEWTEEADETIATLLGRPIAKRPMPFMAPPLLTDQAKGVSIAQMPAILFYLAEEHGLMPEGLPARALALKTLLDANDLLDELTLNGGREMWTAAGWKAFVPRLARWMQIWEETGRQQGLGTTEGYLFHTTQPTIADIVSATLWSTVGSRLPPLGAMLAAVAPRTEALARRVFAQPALARFAAARMAEVGDLYCGGEIEGSLRAVLEGWSYRPERA
ncbi:glutathione S-transferase [Acidisoma sp. C75]